MKATISDLRKFSAMQHFAYYINVKHTREINPWGENFTAHFLDKLTEIVSRENVGHITVGAVYRRIQEMTFDNQRKLLDYVFTYHLDKYMSEFEGEPLN